MSTITLNALITFVGKIQIKDGHKHVIKGTKHRTNTIKKHVTNHFKTNKSEDDDGSRAVFDDVDCFRSQG